MIEIQLDDSNLQRGLSRLLQNATQTAPMMRGMAKAV
ncbi:phage-like protein [Bergeriella denitrificans]|uniref:Phage-like protein n=1 Tax=Bergeriella denitrificans TaxID=494 RepID=A0A378UJL7_BERDE|nr:phage-like protein [Bergeriella denitrificans]